MRESGWYPPGAEFDPNAPYNQVEPEEKEYSIEAVFELRRTDELWSSNYDEFDNLNDAAKEWCALHMTPLELIRKCRALAEHMLESGDITRYPVHVLRNIIAECEGWEETDNDFNEQ